jgi:accessory gene regulator protein AgrB
VFSSHTTIVVIIGNNHVKWEICIDEKPPKYTQNYKRHPNVNIAHKKEKLNKQSGFYFHSLSHSLTLLLFVCSKAIFENDDSIITFALLLFLAIFILSFKYHVEMCGGGENKKTLVKEIISMLLFPAKRYYFFFFLHFTLCLHLCVVDVHE